MQKAMGGAMYDMGVYAVNEARILTGLEPISIPAKHDRSQLSPMQSYTGVTGSTSDEKILAPYSSIQQAVQMDNAAFKSAQKGKTVCQ